MLISILNLIITIISLSFLLFSTLFYHTHTQPFIVNDVPSNVCLSYQPPHSYAHRPTDRPTYTVLYTPSGPHIQLNSTRTLLATATRFLLSSLPQSLPAYSFTPANHPFCPSTASAYLPFYLPAQLHSSLGGYE